MEHRQIEGMKLKSLRTVHSIELDTVKPLAKIKMHMYIKELETSLIGAGIMTDLQLTQEV